MNYFHDGYYLNPETMAAQIQRWHKAGWTLIAVIPPGLSNEYRQAQGASIMWAHPTKEQPEWEE